MPGPSRLIWFFPNISYSTISTIVSFWSTFPRNRAPLEDIMQGLCRQITSHVKLIQPKFYSTHSRFNTTRSYLLFTFSMKKFSALSIFTHNPTHTLRYLFLAPHSPTLFSILSSLFNPLSPLSILLALLCPEKLQIAIAHSIGGIDKFETELTTLHPILTECRVIKSDLELALIQFANDISSEAHVEVMRKVRAGMKEYQLESMFLHHTYMYGGCRHCSYTCICATGGNSAVLHYGHAAAPNDKTFEDGDMALLDMGAEYNFYGSDITCSFPVNGKFTPDQLLIYNAVLDAHDAIISMMKPGVSWLDMHKLAEKIILESLRGGGVLVGNVDDMMAERVGALFMPHGLGHLLGLDTHDPGGYTKGMQRLKEPGLKSLRTTREIQAGMVITVEPGCYFIDDLLVPAMESSNTTEFFNREAIARFKGFGGVRIESDLYLSHCVEYWCSNLIFISLNTEEFTYTFLLHLLILCRSRSCIVKIMGW
ncbi:hypothetical protein UlMin_040989 [Ulmus minor]